jgi:TRAP-type mannitol/chloroaromatic compound transport system permease large subunit
VTPVAISVALFALLLVLLAGGVWIAISMGVVAWLGLQLFTTSPPEVNLFQAFWGSNASWTLAALPLFVWMGEILFRTRLSDEMFEGLAPWLGWLPGRLMHVNIFGCGIFAAVSGSSSATCATIAKVALPELIKRGYDEKTCLGSLCGAGTLGLLIPPSRCSSLACCPAPCSSPCSPDTSSCGPCSTRRRRRATLMTFHLPKE